MYKCSVERTLYGFSDGLVYISNIEAEALPIRCEDIEYIHEYQIWAL